MEKVIKDGKVAVLVSKGYGAGWYSWHGVEALLYHPKIVELVESGKKDEITESLCKSLVPDYKDTYLCVLGANDLVIEWVEQGTPFTISEYDGAERLETSEYLTLTA